jgi:hypothetical protein
MFPQRCLRDVSNFGSIPRLNWLSRRVTVFLYREYTSSSLYTVLQTSRTAEASSIVIDESTEPSDSSIISTGENQRQQLQTTSATVKPKPLVPLPRPSNPTATRFFRYSDQRTSSGSPVTLRFANTVQSANWLASKIKGNVLGLDLEWKSWGTMNVSLVQICDEETILLVHIAQMKGTIRALA